MGCAASTEGIPKGSKEEQKTSHDIDVELEDARKEMARETKLLLLGAGESGKSTLAKQIKIIHLQGYTEEEVMLFVPIIYSNIVNSVRSICDGLKKLKIPVEDPHIQEICQKVEQDECYQYFNGDLTQEMAAEIKLLWTDPNVQLCVSRSSEYQLLDNTK